MSVKSYVRNTQMLQIVVKILRLKLKCLSKSYVRNLSVMKVKIIATDSIAVLEETLNGALGCNRQLLLLK